MTFLVLSGVFWLIIQCFHFDIFISFLFSTEGGYTEENPYQNVPMMKPLGQDPSNHENLYDTVATKQESESEVCYLEGTPHQWTIV